MPTPSIEHVTTDTALTDVIARLKKAEVVAFDTEFLREKTFYPKLCLVQLYFGESLVVVDPLACDATPLLEALVDGEHMLLVHSGEQDLEILWHQTGRLPKRVFDTQCAGAMLGLGEQAGYGALVEKRLGLTLEKKFQRLDWSRRPIPAEALEYAADDVRHLRPLYKLLRADLESRGRFAWAEEESARLLDSSRYAPDLALAYRRVKGQSKLSGPSRGALALLARWREEQARKRDLPRKRVLTDELIIDIARQRPKGLSGLEKLRGMDRGRVQKDGAQLLELVEEGLKLPKSEWPPRSEGAPLSPEQEALADVVMGLARLYCAQHEIGVSTVVTRGEIQSLVRGERELAMLEGWRGDLVGQLLLGFLEGREAVSVKQGVLHLSPSTD